MKNLIRKNLFKKAILLMAYGIWAFIDYRSLTIDGSESSRYSILKYIIVFIGLCISYLLVAAPRSKKLIEKAKETFTPQKSFEFEKDIPVSKQHQLDQMNWLINSVKTKFADIRSLDRNSSISALNENSEIVNTCSVFGTVVDYLSLKHLESKRRLSWSNDRELNTHAILLGKPGAGKSNRMLDGVMQLLPETVTNETNQLPVYINLIDFNNDVSDHFESLSEWLMYQLNKVYGSKAYWLVHNHYIMPFLDGFDEVDDSKKVRCLDLILDFAVNNRTVISGRLEEFTASLKQFDLKSNDELKLKLNRFRVYVLNDFDKEEIDNLLDNELNLAETTHRSVALPDKLKGLLITPLLINLCLKTYTNLDNEDYSKLKKFRDRNGILFLWNIYDTKILKAKFKSLSEYEWFKAMLMQMARVMKDNSFIIEKMIQPWWLPDAVARWLYYFSSRLICGILLSIAVGLMLASPFEFLANGVICSLLVAALTMFYNKRDKHTEVKITASQKSGRLVIYIAIVCFASTLYHGIKNVRLPEDMIGNYAKTDGIAGLIFGLFFGAVFGISYIFGDLKSDIRSIDKYKFNSKSFLWGLRGALFVGGFAGGMGLLLSTLIETSFANRWLFDFIDNNLGLINYKLLGVFILAFGVGAVLGFLVFFISTSIDREKSIITDNEKKSYRHGLNQRLSRAFLTSLIVGGTCFIVLILVFVPMLYILNEGDADSIRRGIGIAGGISLITMLMLGGLEMINHWVLRIYLWIYGIAPLRFSELLRSIQEHRIILKSGASLGFIHTTLQEYFAKNFESEKKLINKHRSAFSIIILSAVLLSSSIGIVYQPLRNKYIDLAFWIAPHNFNMHFENNGYLYKLGKSQVKVVSDGKIIVRTTGTVKLGTYLGQISPNGTTVGFMGFPLQEQYNIVKGIRHGSLMYQQSSSAERNKWKGLYQFRKSFGKMQFIDTISVRQGDTLTFVLNDDEYQNNTGKLNIYLHWIKN